MEHNASRKDQKRKSQVWVTGSGNSIVTAKDFPDTEQCDRISLAQTLCGCYCWWGVKLLTRNKLNKKGVVLLFRQGIATEVVT